MMQWSLLSQLQAGPSVKWLLQSADTFFFKKKKKLNGKILPRFYYETVTQDLKSCSSPSFKSFSSSLQPKEQPGRKRGQLL